ncbi:MAG: HEAT repeat domain-containing protein [Chloroflexi bacterium]|nr:HEAT repeat domain-containing protein [Chloroflexota bacterium]
MNWLTGGKTGEVKRLISQLADASKRDHAAHELIRLGTEAAPALIEALQTNDLNLLPLYGQILTRIPSATPVLTKALGTAHPLVRGRVCEILAVTRDRAAVPALMDALHGEFYTVRAKAAAALGSIGDPKFIHELLPALNDPEDEVRIAAVLALGKYREPSTFDEMGNVLLDDPIIEVRQAAARALGNTKHPEAVFFLMQAIRDAFWWYEREHAAGDLLQAIENIGAPAVDSLIEALADREGTVRKFAATILGKIGDPRAIEELGMALYDLHHEVSLAAAESLAQFGAPVIEVMAEALRHPESAVREHAIIGLGKIQDARVAPLLIQMLKDPERIVQKQAIKSLGQLHDSRAEVALKEIASNRADREFSMLAKQMMENNKAHSS